MEEQFFSYFYHNKEDLAKDAEKAKEILEKAGARQEDIEGLLNRLYMGCTDEVIWTIVHYPQDVFDWAERVGFDDKHKFMNFKNSCIGA